MDRLHLKKYRLRRERTLRTVPGLCARQKEAQMDTLQDVHDLEHAMVV